MVTEEEWHGEMAKAKRLRFISPLAGLIVLGLLTVPAVAIGRSFGSGVAAYAVTAGVLMALLLPLIYLLVIISDRQQRKTDDKVRTLTHELTEAIEVADREGVTRELQGQRQRFESRLANALDMAEGEPEVIDVIERSFAAVVPDAPVELLLADNSHAHLLRMAGVGPDGEPPSCSVDSPDRCRRPGGPRCRSSGTATTSMRAPSSATGRRVASPRCACRSPSWVARSASSTPPTSPTRWWRTPRFRT